jgi:FR47-like protein
MSTLREQRALIAPLLDTSSPADAPTAYYALYHDPNRSALFVQTDAEGKAVGFVGRFQTGVDLFRPVVSIHCAQPEVAADLISQALVSGRPYLLFSNVSQWPNVGGSLEISNQRILSIYTLQRSSFSPVINVLVVTKTAPDGTPRAEIHSSGLQAVAGLNWQSPGFAEIYVHVEAEGRHRGWGRSVAAAVTERVLASGRIPIYLVEVENLASVELAESLGYVDTGAKQVFADVIYAGHPGRTP